MIRTRNELIQLVDRGVGEAESIARHDNWEAGAHDHLKQSRVGTFKLAEVATFTVAQ